MSHSETSAILKYLDNNGQKTVVDKCSTCKPCLQIPTSLGVNVVYIVAAVIRENDKILLIQEAKTSCYGRWYLPAGRVNKGETLVNAVKREVFEESGLRFKPTGIACVEFDGPSWMRFVFTGQIKGGALKTRKDAESLQALWFKYEEIEPEKLRSSDALRLIDATTSYINKGINSKILPYPAQHSLQAYRILLVFSWNKNEYMLLSIGKHGSGLDLPTACYSGETVSVAELVRQYLSKFMAESNAAVTSKISFGSTEIFGIEHNPVKIVSEIKRQDRYFDGVVVDCIIRAKCIGKRPELPRLKPGSMCKWVALSPGSELEVAIKRNENNSIKFMDLSSHDSSS